MLPGRHKEKASAFRRWLVTRAYSPHPEPPVLRVGAIRGSKAKEGNGICVEGTVTEKRTMRIIKETHFDSACEGVRMRAEKADGRARNAGRLSRDRKCRVGKEKRQHLKIVTWRLSISVIAKVTVEFHPDSM